MAAGGMHIFVRRGDRTECVEVAADATVGDLAQAARGDADVLPDLLYHGRRLADPGESLADAGVCPEATVDAISESVTRWLPVVPIPLDKDCTVRPELYDITNGGTTCSKVREFNSTYDIVADTCLGSWTGYQRCEAVGCPTEGADYERTIAVCREGARTDCVHGCSGTPRVRINAPGWRLGDGRPQEAC
eukprot:TRINITY_DN24686_c0_g1_i2.p1 TRINITY_DN24686_c0_g1~~TRINITY_DN24686_c0_g1_i2.p1  ORF type:complete len:222 (+),score=14.61 TRINITY_DN24686_c0_g1_i2:97-666(+)